MKYYMFWKLSATPGYAECEEPNSEIGKQRNTLSRKKCLVVELSLSVHLEFEVIEYIVLSMG